MPAATAPTESIPLGQQYGQPALDDLVIIYWNNHHPMMQAARQVNGRVLWANLHLLFWLSLFPFATVWTGENHFAALPVAFYGVVLLLAAIAYSVLSNVLIAHHHGKDSPLAIAIGRNTKGRLSTAICLVAIPLAFARPWLADILYVLVALIWLIPDRRIEKTLLY